MPENDCVFRGLVVSQSRGPVVLWSRSPAVSQSRSPVGAPPSLSQLFPAVLSLSQPIARLSAVLSQSRLSATIKKYLHPKGWDADIVLL